MKKANLTFIWRIGLLVLLMSFGPTVQAQQHLHISPLFEKYGNQNQVTRVELHESLLRSYRMTLYKSLVFEDVAPYLEEILSCLKQDAAAGNVRKTQEITESGRLSSAYYRLETAKRQGKTVNRYILFKRDRKNKAALIYIEGPLLEDELMNILYPKQED